MWKPPDNSERSNLPRPNVSQGRYADLVAQDSLVADVQFILNVVPELGQ